MSNTTTKFASVDSLELLLQAEAELGTVVRYGLSAIADGIDREHIASAYTLIGLVVKAQREQP